MKGREELKCEIGGMMMVADTLLSRRMRSYLYKIRIHLKLMRSKRVRNQQLQD